MSFSSKSISRSSVSSSRSSILKSPDKSPMKSQHSVRFDDSMDGQLEVKLHLTNLYKKIQDSVSSRSPSKLQQSSPSNHSSTRVYIPHKDESVSSNNFQKENNAISLVTEAREKILDRIGKFKEPEEETKVQVTVQRSSISKESLAKAMQQRKELFSGQSSREASPEERSSSVSRQSKLSPPIKGRSGSLPRNNRSVSSTYSRTKKSLFSNESSLNISQEFLPKTMKLPCRNQNFYQKLNNYYCQKSSDSKSSMQRINFFDYLSTISQASSPTPKLSTDISFSSAVNSSYSKEVKKSQPIQRGFVKKDGRSRSPTAFFAERNSRKRQSSLINS